MGDQHPSRFAASAPDRVAVAGAHDVLTYGDLEARSNRVAHLLRSLGLGVGDPVPGYTPYEDALADELIGFCRNRIAHYKCPRSVVFVDELPRLPTGKIARRMLPEEVPT